MNTCIWLSAFCTDFNGNRNSLILFDNEHIAGYLCFDLMVRVCAMKVLKHRFNWWLI